MVCILTFNISDFAQWWWEGAKELLAQGGTFQGFGFRGMGNTSGYFLGQMKIQDWKMQFGSIKSQMKYSLFV